MIPELFFLGYCFILFAMGEEEPFTWERLHKWIADHKREASKRGETPWRWEQMQKWMADCKDERIEREI